MQHSILFSTVGALAAVLAIGCTSDSATSPAPSRAGVLAADEAGVQMVPLKGPMDGTSQPFVPDPRCGTAAVLKPVALSGHATHLGAFDYVSSHCVDFRTPNFDRGIGTITAANGDQLFVTYVGAAIAPHAPPFGPGDVIRFPAQYTITGGTGRFEGARGTAEIDCALDVGTNTLTCTIDGQISSAGSSK